MNRYLYVFLALLALGAGFYFYTAEDVDPGEIAANSVVDHQISNEPIAVEEDEPMISEEAVVIENNEEPALEKPKIDVEPVNISLDENDAILGDPNAPITLIEFSDFQCPFCRSFYQTTYQEIKRDYVDTGKVKYVYKDLPLPFHNKALVASVAARCAGNQGKFYEMHDMLFDRYDGWTTAEDTREEFVAYAKELKLKMRDYNKCYDEQEVRGKIESDVRLGQVLGVKGTPGFFVDGYFIPGAYPYNVFQQIIDTLLEEKAA